MTNISIFMRIGVSIILTIFVGAIYGQTNKITTIPTFKNVKNEIDTSLWFKWKYDLAKRINLEDLQTSNDTFHFRFWTDIQAIDIWTKDYIVFSGSVTNYAQRYDDKLLKKGVHEIGKVYFNQVSLDSSRARKVFKMLEKLSIVAIPADEKIPGWQQGFDGQEFLIETSTPTLYDFKTYWTPKVFADSLKEAKQIQAFVDYLFEEFKILDYYKKLRLPEGSYQRDGIKGIEVQTTNQYVPGATSVIDML